MMRGSADSCHGVIRSFIRTGSSSTMPLDQRKIFVKSKGTHQHVFLHLLCYCMDGVLRSAANIILPYLAGIDEINKITGRMKAFKDPLNKLSPLERGRV